MNALEELLNEYNMIGKFSVNDTLKFYERLNSKYLVTLKNSKDDNTKSEQVIDQEQMMAEIESMGLALYNSTDSLTQFQAKLKDCFAMHFKADSNPANISDGQSITAEELVSKIEKIVFHAKENVKTESFKISCRDYAKEIIKTFNTYQKSGPIPVIEKDEQSVTDEELLNKVTILSNGLINYSLTENIHIANKIALVDFVEQELLQLFKIYKGMPKSSPINLDNQTINEEKLLSEIKNAMNSLSIEFTQAGASLGDYSGYYSITNKQSVSKYLLELFKTYNMSNSNQNK